MISLYESGINGILADDMGLGKTIQTISFIAFLKEFKQINGPHIIIAPLTTIGNWAREFKYTQYVFFLFFLSKWLPGCRVVKLLATKEQRDQIFQNELKSGQFDVIITSYEGVTNSLTKLRNYLFKYVIIDEAHKMKNEEA